MLLTGLSLPPDSPTGKYYATLAAKSLQMFLIKTNKQKKQLNTTCCRISPNKVSFVFTPAEQDADLRCIKWLESGMIIYTDQIT